MATEDVFTDFLRLHPQHVAGVRTVVVDGREQTVGDTDTMCAFIDWCVSQGHTSWERGYELKLTLRMGGGR